MKKFFIYAILLYTIIFKGSIYAQNPRLIGGTQIDISEAPYQVSIIRNGRHDCGGSILNSEWILTACHCVDNNIPLNSISVHAGSTNWKNLNEGQLRSVDQIILNNDFNGNVWHGSDLALLHLSTPLCFNAKVRPIVYATFDITTLSDIAPGVEARLTGWGWDTDGNLHDILEELFLPIMSDNDANGAFGNVLCEDIQINDPIDETQIAFNGAPIESSLGSGDSGGPATIDINGNKVLIGVCSWGQCHPDRQFFPSVYADVRALSNFIGANITIPECKGYCVNVEGNEIWDATNIFELYESFDISGNLTINNATIHMVPGGKINILSGGSLLLNNSTITGCNDNFWDGIAIKNIAYNDPSPSLTLNNGSKIEKAYDAIKLENVSNPPSFVFTGDSKLINNNKAISIFNSSTFIMPITISNCNFENNGNSFHIFKSKGIVIANCNFTNGVNEIVLQQSNNISFEGNNFKSKRKAIIAEYKNENVTIANNTFSNIHYEVNGTKQGAGIFASDSKLNITGGNNFIDCDFGVKADASFGNYSDVIIENDNYFNLCGSAIDIAGISGTEGARIINNVFEDNNNAINADGENHFDIAQNLIANSSEGIKIATSGDHNINSINCNDLENYQTGMEIVFRNNFTSFLGNLFSYSQGMDVLLFDTDIEDNIGDITHPAFNIFSSSFENAGIFTDYWFFPTDPFNYYLPSVANPIPNTDPLHIPPEWEINALQNQEPQDCTMPPSGQVDKSTVIEWMTVYCQLLARYKNNPSIALKREIEIVKKRLIRYYNYIYKNWPSINIEALLKWMCDNWFKQKKLYNLYITTGQCSKADSLLNTLELSLREPCGRNTIDSLERIEKQSFLAIQRIGLKYHCSTVKDSTVFTQSDIDILFTEGNKMLPESAFARALYYYATGRILVPDRQSYRAGIQPQLVTLETDYDYSVGFNIYPNPASDMITIQSNEKSDFHGYIKLVNIFGKLLHMEKIKESGTNTIDLRSLSINDGMYIISIEDNNNKVIESKKILIVRK